MSGHRDPTRPFDCLDCGVDTNAIHEYYMVKYNVWRQAVGDTPDCMLCVGCLEKRIGRTLQRHDFTEHMNQMELFPRGFSDRLNNRLGAT